MTIALSPHSRGRCYREGIGLSGSPRLGGAQATSLMAGQGHAGQLTPDLYRVGVTVFSLAAGRSSVVDPAVRYQQVGYPSWEIGQADRGGRSRP